jgi:ribonuclease P protein component
MKCGVAVSKKTAKNAVERNKIRRRIFTIFREEKGCLRHKHVAILTKHSIQNLSKKELQKEITETLKQTET